MEARAVRLILISVVVERLKLGYLLSILVHHRRYYCNAGLVVARCAIAGSPNLKVSGSPQKANENSMF